MQRLNKESPQSTTIQELCAEFRSNNAIPRAQFERFDVKRGLRNADGTGVMAGLTHVCNVHGYLIDDGDKIPDKGRLTYRGISIEDIVQGCQAEGRFGFEEVAWLLIFGKLPDQRQYKRMCDLLYDNRELPEYFPEDMILKAPSRDIMNKLSRSVLALYSYDDDPEDSSLENNMRQGISLIARMPSIMAYSYQVKRRHFDKESMFFHPYEPGHRTAEAILNALRPDRQFTHEEAVLLDLCMMLHAEHGGGNNSTFTTRVLTSAGTDIYSAIGAAVGSLKGVRHGGANHRVRRMMEDIMANVADWADEDEVERYLEKILRGEAADGSGLIYGMGHAIYTLSDPRAVILKRFARKLAADKGMLDEFELFETVEKLTPGLFQAITGQGKAMCANVDLYSGLVYKMMGIPSELYTPLFAIARIVGWCAHRVEEVYNPYGRIIRPAYKAVMPTRSFVPLEERGGN